MPTTLTTQVIWAAVFLVCLFGLLKGGPAERFGAGLTLAIAIAFQIVNSLLATEARAVPHLVLDGVLALGFLVLAVRYASLWLGGVMLLQGVQFSLHAYFFVTKLTPGETYAVVNNLVTCGTLLGILLGTVAYLRQNRAALSAKQPAPTV
jgi:hypothetical protein